jgi:hypothetical protein
MTELIVPALQNVSSAMERIGWTNLEELCGVEDMSVFSSQVEALQTQLCQLAQSVLDARLLLNCPEWVQWYQVGAYYGVCYTSSTALAWAASTQLVIMVLCMIIVTLRVSYYELPEVADEGSSNKCVSDWCCCVEVMKEEDEEEEEEEEEEEGVDEDDDNDEDSDSENHSTHSGGNSKYGEEQVDGDKVEGDDDDNIDGNSTGSTKVDKVEEVNEQSKNVKTTAMVTRNETIDMEIDDKI